MWCEIVDLFQIHSFLFLNISLKLIINLIQPLLCLAYEWSGPTWSAGIILLSKVGVSWNFTPWTDQWTDGYSAKVLDGWSDRQVSWDFWDSIQGSWFQTTSLWSMKRHLHPDTCCDSWRYKTYLNLILVYFMDSWRLKWPDHVSRIERLTFTIAPRNFSTPLHKHQVISISITWILMEL